MERSVAVKRLRKVLGKNMGYRVDEKAPTPDEREAARESLPELKQRRDAAEKAANDRRRVILENDAEYKELCAKAKDARQTHEREGLQKIHRHKFTVGTVNGLFFHVVAEGDTWEEVLEKVRLKKGL